MITTIEFMDYDIAMKLLDIEDVDTTDTLNLALSHKQPAIAKSL